MKLYHIFHHCAASVQLLDDRDVVALALSLSQACLLLKFRTLICISKEDKNTESYFRNIISGLYLISSSHQTSRVHSHRHRQPLIKTDVISWLSFSPVAFLLQIHHFRVDSTPTLAMTHFMWITDRLLRLLSKLHCPFLHSSNKPSLRLRVGKCLWVWNSRLAQGPCGSDL